ncbi:LacI family DNA-binding transcriptional regulator [Bifidobacterium simiarum]|uniref:LacI family DNA-binding transcriptional regulator n=1 Tax=Bifidobacterium simiarum TaxID=2045441 RepID=UPI001BDD41D4|nr:LacI family DNA-binding transcriptional regulator [Bifidobacterium simiarum]MBT1165391.1 LacI family DNA-binding transcriptional regulator [Bifidobacterium simiarum]
MTTLDDVAREAGVSRMTASNAINGKTNVSPKTAEKVLRAARKLNYTINLSAKRLSSGKSGILGFAAVDLDNLFPAQLAADFSDAAAARGYQTIVQQTRRSQSYEYTMSHDIMTQLCDGVLLCSPAMPETTIAGIDERIPAIIFDSTQYDRRFDTIATPCTEGAYEATRHLIEQGCSNLLVIGTDYREPRDIGHSSSPAERRLLGCMQACDEAGIPLGRRQVRPVAWSNEEARRCVHDIVDSDVPFDGIFCITDHFAPGVLRGLAECGLDVPKDVAVASFDGIATDQYTTPPLTSVSIDTKEIARRALDRLIERIEAKRRGTEVPPERIVVGYRLAMRGSSLRNR